MTVDRYIYFLDKIGKDILDSIKTKEDLVKLKDWMIKKEGHGDFSYIKNWRIGYYAVKSYIKFKGLRELDPYLEKDWLKQSIKRKSVGIKYWDEKQVEQFIKMSKYKKVNITKDINKDFDESAVLSRNDKYVVISKEPEESARDYLFTKFLFKTGSRVFEALNVCLDDLSLKQEKVFIRIGKGGKSREALITKELISELTKYVELMQIGSDKTIFCFDKNNDKDHPKRAYFMEKFGARKGADLFKNWAYRGRAEYMLKKVGKLCVSERIVTPHQMRHSLAMFLRNNDMSLDMIQKILGHASITTTQVYANITIDHAKPGYDKIVK